MIIYNVTVNIDDNVRDDWKKWMLNTHIPEVMETGLFSGYKFCKLLKEEPQGTTYAIQYYCHNKKALEDYMNNHAPALQKSHIDRYKDKFVAFRSFLEVENEKSEQE